MEDESENDQNDTKVIHTDESDEKTKVEAENVHIVGNYFKPNLI